MKDKKAIACLRKRIDSVNLELLSLLNKRVIIAKKIGRIKKKFNAPVSDRAREQAILRTLVGKNKGPLDDAAVNAIFSRIIRETKRLEKTVARKTR